MATFLHFWRRSERNPKQEISSDVEMKKIMNQARRNSAEGADLGDMEHDQLTCSVEGEIAPTSLFMEFLPREIHFVILSFLDASDLCAVAQINKEFRFFVLDDMLWKTMYLKRWLSKADSNFVSKYYPRDFEWREMYQRRISVEKKYLHEMMEEMSRRNRPERGNWIDTNDWRCYLRKGKLLAKYTTEDLPEFLLLASIEQEQYKSAAVLANNEKEKKDTGELSDIYYYWGRCIKDLSRNKAGMDKLKNLLEEQEKYQIAAQIEPKDSYILYSWAINLRFQLEHLEGEQAIQVYKDSSKKYRTALQYGYLEKYVLWGLGSLKLHMAKKLICVGKEKDAAKYLDKAEKKYGKLQRLWEEGDVLTSFSLCFNYSCIFSSREKIIRAAGKKEEAEAFRQRSVDKLKECASKQGYAEYLTLDLLDLWYFDEIRDEQWFKDIYTKSKPKKLSATW